MRKTTSSSEKVKKTTGTTTTMVSQAVRVPKAIADNSKTTTKSSNPNSLLGKSLGKTSLTETNPNSLLGKSLGKTSLTETNPRKPKPRAQQSAPVQSAKTQNNKKPANVAKSQGEERKTLINRRRYEMTFNNYLIYLLNMLHQLEAMQYPKIKEYLDQAYLRYSKLADNERVQEYLEHVYERFQPHIKLIAEQDDFLFSTDYNNKTELKLISGLPLHEIWQFLDALGHSLEFEESEDPALKLSVDKAMQLKKCIWDSLLNLYVSCCLSLNKTDDPWAISILQNLRLSRQLEKEIEEEPEEDENNSTGLPNIADFEKIFNSDNAFGQIIKDIGNEINPQDYMQALNPDNKPPLEMIMGLFSGTNTAGIQNVAQSLTEKFATKMKERGYTPEDLTLAANDIKKDLCKIPGLGGLLSQLNTEIVIPSNLGENCGVETGTLRSINQDADVVNTALNQDADSGMPTHQSAELPPQQMPAEFGQLLAQAFAHTSDSAPNNDIPPEMKSMFDMIKKMQDQSGLGDNAFDTQDIYNAQCTENINQKANEEEFQCSDEHILAEQINQPSVD